MDGDGDSYADDLWEELLQQKDNTPPSAKLQQQPREVTNQAQSPNYTVMGCYDCPFFHAIGNSGECTGKKTRLILQKTVGPPDSCPLIKGSITIKLVRNL